MKTWLKTSVKLLAIWTVILFCFLALFEWCYRSYAFDFYGNVFNVLNPSVKSNKNKQNLLIFGDSFGTHHNNYAQLLQDSSDFHTINLSIPGTSGKEHAIFALKNIKKHQPGMVLFQLYVGNDLLDVAPPIHWGKLPFSRNVYWSVSKYFTSLKYLNFGLGQFRAITNNQLDTIDLAATHFSKNQYSERTKLYLKANAAYIQQAVLLTPPMTDAFSMLMNAYQSITSHITTNTKVFFLIIPHCIQTHDRYLQQYQQLGMSPINSTIIQQIEYPFVTQLQATFPNAQIINPLGFFQQLEQSGMPLYYSNDPHLNETGQRMLYDFSLKLLQ